MPKTHNSRAVSSIMVIILSPERIIEDFFGGVGATIRNNKIGWQPASLFQYHDFAYPDICSSLPIPKFNLKLGGKHQGRISVSPIGVVLT